jgi:hypothetical protein
MKSEQAVLPNPCLEEEEEEEEEEEVIKTYGRVEVQSHTFLTSSLDEGEWSASRPGKFTLGKESLGIHGYSYNNLIDRKSFTDCCT